MAKTYRQPTPEELERIFSTLMQTISKYGLKATTMDMVAESMHISKRTLYEIFENKRDMVMQMMEWSAAKHRAETEQVLRTAPDMMSAFKQIFDIHSRGLTHMSPAFFKDMDRLYPEFKKNYAEANEERHRYMTILFNKGVAQGVFRKEVNYLILERTLMMQFEALKRIEEMFPPETTITEVYKTIGDGFLRTIASSKGLEILESLGSGAESSE